ncbi:hypothetical protein [Flavobacterium sp. 14A]|uniref:hypothetical protein n=1 Tax=Flavobacterium sp. 14A TaxID=2735896 RepID=UPI00157102B2|nr:hypothetical protein [Flavobacterium sp. 14A]NRT11536.1 hypothetical protein [Flavobacterium sp. 14A]
MTEKLRSLKVKKARLWSDIESLAVVNDAMYCKFGKLTVEVMKLEKELVRASENNIQ